MGVVKVHTGVADTRYLSIYLLRRAKRNSHFDPPKLGDRSLTGGLIALLYQSLHMLQPPSLRTQLWPTRRRSPTGSIMVLWTVLYQAGEDGSLPSPVFGFIWQGGDGSLPSPVFGFLQENREMALYRPLCSVV